MRVEVLWEYGYRPALFGLGFSYGLTSDYYFFETGWREQIYARLCRVSQRCAQRGNGEEKFLRMIQIWADVTAPRFWWAEFDTYKVGTVSLSESTMHTLGKRPLEQEDFEGRLPFVLLALLNARTCTPGYTIEAKKELLPESFLQRRIVNFNYAVFANMIRQRRNHRLPQWHYFLNKIYYGLPLQDFLPPLTAEKGKE